MNHSRKVTPIPIIFKGFDIFGRRIQNDDFEHGSPNNVDKSADADAYVDDKNEVNEDTVPATPMTRCNYGQILFKTKKDFKR